MQRMDVIAFPPAHLSESSHFDGMVHLKANRRIGLPERIARLGKGFNGGLGFKQVYAHRLMIYGDFLHKLNCLTA